MLGTHVITVGDENDEEVEGDPDEVLSRLEHERDGDSQSALVDDGESRTKETSMTKQAVEGNAAMRGRGVCLVVRLHHPVPRKAAVAPRP